MTNNQEYIYSFPNTSCTLRAMNHLQNKYQDYLDSVAVIHLIDRWLVKLDLNSSISFRSVQNLQAFLNEMGSISHPSGKIREALNSLDRGESPTKVMNRHRVAIIVHGKLEIEEIKIFRDHIVERLGYCPQNMA